jgi:hypothetical protein
VSFPATYIWPARLTPSLQARSRRNAWQAMNVVAQRRRERDDLARFLAERGLDAG